MVYIYIKEKSISHNEFAFIKNYYKGGIIDD